MAEGINAHLSDKIEKRKDLGEETLVDMASLVEQYTDELASKRALLLGNGNEITDPAKQELVSYEVKHLELCIELTKECIELPEEAIELMSEGDHFHVVIMLMATLTMRFIHYLGREISAMVHADEEQIHHGEDTWAFDNTDAFEACKENQALIEGPGNMLLIEDGRMHAHTISQNETDPVQSLADAIVVFIQTHGEAIREYRKHGNRRVLNEGELTKLKVIQYCMTTPHFARVCFAMLVLLELDAYGLCLLGLLNPHAPISDKYKVLSNLDPLNAPAYVEEILNTDVLDAVTWSKVKNAKKEIALLEINPEEADLTSDTACTAFVAFDDESDMAAGERDTLQVADFEQSENYINDVQMLIALAFYCKLARDIDHPKGKDAEGIVKALIEQATEAKAASFAFEDGKRIEKELFDHAVAALLQAWLSIEDEEKQGILRGQFAAMQAPTVKLGVIEEVKI